MFPDVVALFNADLEAEYRKWKAQEEAGNSASVVETVPFPTLACACKHANLSCVDPDNRIYDRVCLHTRREGQSWGVCSFETCPLVKEKSK